MKLGVVNYNVDFETALHGNFNAFLDKVLDPFVFGTAPAHGIINLFNA